MESPPPYDAALHQPIKKNSPIQQHQRIPQQQLINQQQKEYMGSNTRLISGSNTPIQQKHLSNTATSHSYTMNTPQQPQNLSLINASTPGMSASLQQLQYQNSLQYTAVHNMENRARSRNPLNALSNDIDNQQQHHPTQYTTMAAQLSANPIDV